jgi:hypothetical protein
MADTLMGTAPAGVNDAGGNAYRIVQKNRQTVGCKNAERNSRDIGYKPVEPF